MQRQGQKTIANNPRARHDYFILETYEAGLALKGTEVKSIRQGKINIKEAYIVVQAGELWLVASHISPYREGNRFNVDPLRQRKLLMHKREIRQLGQKTQQAGLTLIPLRVYLKYGKVKLELAVARGKKNYDKRQDMIKRDVERNIRARLG